MQFRNTKQKSMIFSTIHKYGHLTVEQIKELLEKENVSIATIYRNLNIDIDPKFVNIKIDHSIAKTTRKTLFLYGICSSCQN